jgi:hypothetical protein
MNSFLSKLRLLGIGLVVFSFLAAVTLNSCTSKEGGEQATETEEHPADSEEHPTDSEDEEHPNEEEEEEGTE